MKRFIIIITLMALSSLAVGCRRTEEAGSRKRLPLDVSLRALDGQTISMNDYAGRVLLINFWASWCGPCKEEMPDLQKLYDKWKDKGLVVMGISVDASEEDARSFVETHGFTYPIFWDGDNGPVADALGGVIALPTTLVYDRNGALVKKIIGPRSLEEFEKIVTPLLKTS